MSLEIPPIHYLVHDEPTRAQLPTSTFPKCAERGLSIQRGKLTLEHRRYIKASIIVMNLVDCSFGPGYQPPCDFSIIHRIQLFSEEKVSLGGILDVSAQITLTVRACAEYIELLGWGQYLIAIPFGEVILCLAKLYTNIQQCIRSFSKNERDTHDRLIQRIGLLQSIFSAVFCVVCIVFYFYIAQFAAPLKLCLNAVIYFISLCEFLSIEYCATLPLPM